MKKILFFLLSLALLILIGIFIQKEFNPEWNKYQSTFNKLKYQQVKAELKQAEAEFESPEIQQKYQQLKREYETAQAEIDEEKYDAVVRRLKDADRDLNKLLDKLQKAKIEFQKLEIIYKLGDTEKKEQLRKEIDIQRKQIEALEAEQLDIQQRKDDAVAEKAQLTQKRDELKRELERLTSNLNRLKRALVEIENRKPQIKQITIAPLNVVDRCTTCHLGVLETKMTDVEQPYTSHPEVADAWRFAGLTADEVHEFEKFGCASCHRGQGRAITAKEAHGLQQQRYAMLPPKYLQASCGTCHQDNEAPDAPILSDGRKLIAKANCVSCHEIRGYTKPERPTPYLGGLGSMTNRAWLAKWLKNPKDYLPKTKMPRFNLSDEEVRTLSDYLLSSTADLPLAHREGDYDEGATRFRESRCISCHSVNDKGGNLAPDLGQIASKLNVRSIHNYIANPHKYQPGTIMPQYGLSDSDIADIVEYMMLEFVSDEEEEGEEKTAPTPLYPSVDGGIKRGLEKGKAAYKKYGCFACHQIEGQEKITEEVGPTLTGIGSRTIDKLDFGETRIPRTLPDWLFARVKNPRGFGENYKMPDFGFSNEELQAIVTVLLSLTKEEPPIGYRIPRKPESAYKPAGEFGKIFDKYRCFSCHKVSGRGGDLSTADLSFEGSKVKEEWLYNYLKIPDAIRPILEERMPGLKFSDEEARLVTNYIKMVYRSDEIPEEIFENGKPPQQLIDEGKNLYYNKYGCQACHIIGTSGGYFGPPLNEVAKRLEPGWIYKWLKNPQALEPKVREPNFGLSDEEAKALTAYLINIKPIK